MPLDIHRPEVPDLSHWIEAMDGHLIGQGEPRRDLPRLGSPAGTMRKWVNKLGRSVGPGLAAAAAAAVMIGVAMPTSHSGQPSSPAPTAVTVVADTEKVGEMIVREEPVAIPFLPVDSRRIRSDTRRGHPESGGVPRNDAGGVPAPARQEPTRGVARPTVY